ncbi:hypothetical protein ACY2EW_21475 [Serratia nevei]
MNTEFLAFRVLLKHTESRLVLCPSSGFGLSLPLLVYTEEEDGTPPSRHSRTRPVLPGRSTLPKPFANNALNHTITITIGGVRGIYNQVEYAEQRRGILQACAVGKSDGVSRSRAEATFSFSGLGCCPLIAIPLSLPFTYDGRYL